MTKKRTTTDLIEIMHHRYYEGKPERLAGLEEAREGRLIARTIFKLRTKARLTHAHRPSWSAPPRRSSPDSKTPITKDTL